MMLPLWGKKMVLFRISTYQLFQLLPFTLILEKYKLDLIYTHIVFYLEGDVISRSQEAVQCLTY